MDLVQDVAAHLRIDDGIARFLAGAPALEAE
jgi:hypothetical protein